MSNGKNEKTIKIEHVRPYLTDDIITSISGYHPDYKATITEENGIVKTGVGETEAEAIENAKKH